MANLYDQLEPEFIALLRIAWDDAVDAGLITGAFNVENESVQLVLKDIAKRLVGVDETVEGIVQDVIGEASRLGWSVSERAAALMERGVTDSPMRAELIAVTESADAYERGAHLAYAASGQVKGTEWLLGPNPCSECLPLGGKIVPLGEEFAPGVKHAPFHPRCTCATSPVLT